MLKSVSLLEERYQEADQQGSGASQGLETQSSTIFSHTGKK